MCEQRVAKILGWMDKAAQDADGEQCFSYHDESGVITLEGADPKTTARQWRNVSRGEWLQILDELGEPGSSRGIDWSNQYVEVRCEALEAALEYMRSNQHDDRDRVADHFGVAADHLMGV